MAKYQSLQKKLVIAAMAGISVLLLVASCNAQASFETNGSENCTCTCLDHQLSLGIEFGDCAYSTISGMATLVSPKDTIGTQNPTFVWKPVEDCTAYCLKVAKANAEPNVFIFQRCYEPYEVLSDRGCSVKPELSELLEDDESYRWWIKTSNCKGESWSNYMEFVYDDDLILSKPTPLSPMGLISAKKPNFKWTTVPAATKYNLQVFKGDSRVANVWFDAEKVAQEDICSALSPVDLPDEVYFWGVRASLNGINEPKDLEDGDLLYFENICATNRARAAMLARMARMINR